MLSVDSTQAPDSGGICKAQQVPHNNRVKRTALSVTPLASGLSGQDTVVQRQCRASLRAAAYAERWADSRIRLTVFR